MGDATRATPGIVSSALEGYSKGGAGPSAGISTSLGIWKGLMDALAGKYNAQARQRAAQLNAAAEMPAMSGMPAGANYLSAKQYGV